MYADLDDADLLTLSGRHPEAFAAFYRRHAEDLLRYFARRTLDPDAAAELTSETFAQAFASCRRFRDRGAGGAGWLYGIARHQLSRYLRRGSVDARARRRLGMPERNVSDEDYDRIEELIDLEQVRTGVAAAYRLLSEEQREAVTLRVIEGRPYQEVARILVCSEEAARARVSRGLRRLVKLMHRADGRSPQLDPGGDLT